jgi:hypothetical protein
MRAEPATDHAERLTMAVTTWVVVADGSRARFFETPGLKLDLREIEDLVNIVPSGPALSEKDREKFAKTVADRVEQGRLHQRYQRLRFAVERNSSAPAKALTATCQMQPTRLDERWRRYVWRLRPVAARYASTTPAMTSSRSHQIQFSPHSIERTRMACCGQVVAAHSPTPAG